MDCAFHKNGSPKKPATSSLSRESDPGLGIMFGGKLEITDSQPAMTAGQFMHSKTPIMISDVFMLLAGHCFSP
jgi:hypothetical protein